MNREEREATDAIMELLGNLNPDKAKERKKESVDDFLNKSNQLLSKEKDE